MMILAEPQTNSECIKNERSNEILWSTPFFQKMKSR